MSRNFLAEANNVEGSQTRDESNDPLPQNRKELFALHLAKGLKQRRTCVHFPPFCTHFLTKGSSFYLSSSLTWASLH